MKETEKYLIIYISELSNQFASERIILFYIQVTSLISFCIFVQRDSLRYAAILNRAIEMGLFSTQYMTALGYSMGAQISGHVCRNLRGKCGNILGNHDNELSNECKE